MPFMRDRFEESDRAFFERVARGFEQIAAAEPGRVRTLHAEHSVTEMQATIWAAVEPLLRKCRQRLH
jgi:thymidylate kinase